MYLETSNKDLLNELRNLGFETFFYIYAVIMSQPKYTRLY